MHIFGSWVRSHEVGLDVRLDMQLGGIVGFAVDYNSPDIGANIKRSMVFFAPIDMSTYYCDLNKADCTSCNDGDRVHNVSIKLKKNSGLFFHCTNPLHLDKEIKIDRSGFGRISRAIFDYNRTGKALYVRRSFSHDSCNCVYGQRYGCKADLPEDPP